MTIRATVNAWIIMLILARCAAPRVRALAKTQVAIGKAPLTARRFVGLTGAERRTIARTPSGRWDTPTRRTMLAAVLHPRPSGFTATARESPPFHNDRRFTPAVVLFSGRGHCASRPPERRP